jgi:hypothetical protein
MSELNLSERLGQEKGKQSWTVAVYLGAMTDQGGPRGKMGSEDKFKRLEELKEETKDSSVTIVADVLTEKGEDPLHPNLAKKTVIGGSYDVTRVVFHNGLEEVVSNAPSQGTAKNVSDLVGYANSHAPGAKMAVVLNLHGSGDQGDSGGVPSPLEDQGAQPQQLADALYKTAPEGKREKIDLLDIDGCYGGQLGELNAFSKSARQMVASETLERTFTLSTGKDDDGQNLNNWLSQLMTHPEMDEHALAKLLVEQANKKMNATVAEATPTLSHFDLENGLPAFDQALNRAGTALADAMKHGRNKAVINSAIDHLPNVAIESDGSTFNGAQSMRDLGEFLRAVEQKIKSGEIKDPAKKLSSALGSLEQSLVDRNGLISAYHFVGSKPDPVDPNHLKFPPMHGLSVYLPDAEARHGKVSDDQLRYLYQLETGTKNSGWKSFLESIVHVDD